jgi:hypothetical protein
MEKIRLGLQLCSSNTKLDNKFAGTVKIKHLFPNS